MTSEILWFVDQPKTEELKYLENETFFLQIKKKFVSLAKFAVAKK